MGYILKYAIENTIQKITSMRTALIFPCSVVVCFVFTHDVVFLRCVFTQWSDIPTLDGHKEGLNLGTSRGAIRDYLSRKSNSVLKWITKNMTDTFS